MLLTFFNFLSVSLLLFLTWKSLDKDIEYEYFSKYIVLIVFNSADLQRIKLMLFMVTIVIYWYSFWYLFLEVYCISYGLTIYETLNRHKCRYLFKISNNSAGNQIMVFNNPYTKGFLLNWSNFITN